MDVDAWLAFANDDSLEDVAVNMEADKAWLQVGGNKGA